tara:strand:- start:35067 stop:35786 length:720 start_codon:yes stop_codon:yes gene_type:complete
MSKSAQRFDKKAQRELRGNQMIAKDNVVKFKQNADPILPQTENQKLLVEAIKTCSQVIVMGPAGTGKSFISVGMAADWYAQNEKNELYICRPMVANGDDIGHLPGTELEKASPWATPALNIIKKRIGADKYECDMAANRIKVRPMQMMQGESLDDCWLVVDEAQEMTVSQAKMIVTRMGVNSKLILNGDIRQCNLKEDSGLQFLIDKIKEHDMDIPVIEFDMEDCQRSDECYQWIKVLY